MTIQPMGCQRRSPLNPSRRGDYVLAVSRTSRPCTSGSGGDRFASEGNTEGFEEHVTSEKGHGPQEARTYAICRPRSRSILRVSGGT